MSIGGDAGVGAGAVPLHCPIERQQRRIGDRPAELVVEAAAHPPVGGGREGIGVAANLRQRLVLNHVHAGRAEAQVLRCV